MSVNPYLASQRFFPEDPQLLQREINNSYVDIAKSINVREIGVYSQSQTDTGKTYDVFETSPSQEAKRILFKLGSIAPGATLTTSHGIRGFTFFFPIYGVVQTASDWRPIPYASATLITDQIQMNVTSTNLVIINGATAPAIISAIVVIEFI